MNDMHSRITVESGVRCGRPVVYSKSGGVPELVGTEAGVGIDADLSWDREIAPEPEALADAVVRVRSSLAAFAAAARARAVDRFDVQHWLSRHREVLEGLVS